MIKKSCNFSKQWNLVRVVTGSSGVTGLNILKFITFVVNF